MAFSVTLPLAWIHRLQVVPTGYLVATYRLYLLYITARPMTDEIETQGIFAPVPRRRGRRSRIKVFVASAFQGITLRLKG